MIVPTLKLIGPAWSRVFRCVWMLEELGLPYELMELSPFSKAVKAFQPSGKVPVLLDYTNNKNDQDPFVLYESVAINTYLGDCYSDFNSDNITSDSDKISSSSSSSSPQQHHRLVPPVGTRKRALYDQTVCCILSELDAQALWIARKHASDSPISKHFGVYPEVVQAAELQFHRINACLAQQCQPYLLGEHFSAADILYVHCLDWSKGMKWHTKWPENLNSYRQLCHERPAYQRAKALRDSGTTATATTATTSNNASKI